MSKNKDLCEIIQFLSNRILNGCVHKVTLIESDFTYNEDIYVVEVRNYVHHLDSYKGVVVRYKSDGKVNEFSSKEYYESIKRYLGKDYHILLSGVNTITNELELIH